MAHLLVTSVEDEVFDFAQRPVARLQLVVYQLGRALTCRRRQLSIPNSARASTSRLARL